MASVAHLTLSLLLLLPFVIDNQGETIPERKLLVVGVGTVTRVSVKEGSEAFPVGHMSNLMAVNNTVKYILIQCHNQRFAGCAASDQIKSVEAERMFFSLSKRYTGRGKPLQCEQIRHQMIISHIAETLPTLKSHQKLLFPPQI